MAISDAQRQHFFSLVAQGVSINEASRQAGISSRSGYRLTRGMDKRRGQDRDVVEEKQPAPKSWADLSTDAKDALGDFNVFGELFLCRRPVPWRREASLRIVDALQERSRRNFNVLNLPPGAGKTTLVHDVCSWLLAGGGLCDPLRGRATRIFLGAFGMSVSVHMAARLKRFLESPRPFYDRFTQRTAQLSLVKEYGRFRPVQKQAPWRDDEFTVEQLDEIDLVEKEPSVLAISREKTFLGERCDLLVFDDLVVGRNVGNAEVREALAAWFTDEVETRVEPGGCLFLVGQRMGPDDLYANRLGLVTTDEDTGEDDRQYEVIRFPVHHETTCDGDHRQWDAQEAGDGCLLDERRLPWHELRRQMQQHPTRYQVLYQQEDTDPAGSLVPQVWLDGGLDVFNVEVPGCWDRDRGFFEWPERADGLKDYVAVDVAATGWWAVEWWSTSALDAPRYLVAGTRRKMGANDLLDWSHADQKFTGLMEEWQQLSTTAGHPIRVWVIESNAFARHLMQYDHFHRWRAKWGVEVIPHQTQRNKVDSKLGVEALLPSLYRDGLKRLPMRRGDLDVLTYMNAKTRELTQWPEARSTDTVMADWIGEYQLQVGNILRSRTPVQVVGLQLPPYLAAQRQEVEAEAA